jgi:hypothetical protein
MTTTVRFDHSKCDHAHSGNEGKKARAKCRKEHAEKAAKAEARKAKATTAKPRAPRKPVAKKETVPAAPPVEEDLTADL